jgi:hypothetical protein
MEDYDDEYEDLFKRLRTPGKEHAARKLRGDLDEAPVAVLIPRDDTSECVRACVQAIRPNSSPCHMSVLPARTRRPRPFMLHLTDLASASRLQVAELGHPVAQLNQGANTSASERRVCGWGGSDARACRRLRDDNTHRHKAATASRPDARSVVNLIQSRMHTLRPVCGIRLQMSWKSRMLSANKSR